MLAHTRRFQSEDITLENDDLDIFADPILVAYQAEEVPASELDSDILIRMPLSQPRGQLPDSAPLKDEHGLGKKIFEDDKGILVGLGTSKIDEVFVHPPIMGIGQISNLDVFTGRRLYVPTLLNTAGGQGASGQSRHKVFTEFCQWVAVGIGEPKGG